MRRIIYVIAACTLSACSHNVDGKYVGQAVHHGFFGTQTAPIEMTIQGNIATWSMMGEQNMFRVRTTGDEIVLYKGDPSTGIVLHVVNGGETLECRECADNEVPAIWEKMQ